MKNTFINLVITVVSLFFLNSCQEESKTFGDLNPPTNLTVTATIVGQDATHPNGDGSGKVMFTSNASNAISYKYVFSDATSWVAPSGIYQKQFTTNGIVTYTINIIASGKGGLSTNKVITLQVRSDFNDAEAVGFLTGGSSKTWYWSASEAGHLGVGQNDNDATKNYFANYYQAAPFEKAGSPSSSCLYNNKLKFSLVGGDLKYELDNQGQTFFNAAFQSVVGGTAGGDNCYTYSTAGIKSVSLSPSTSVVAANNIPNQTRGTVMNFSDNGFMGYYIGQNSYEILSITANRMVVRAVMGGNPALAWYHIFTTIPPVQDPVTDYTNLVFSDDFNVDGAPNPAKWNYDLGAGGWGNGEAQSYTNSPNNIIVQGGSLKITAKAEAVTGANYTSARINSKGKFDFAYGKVEFRAKLPTGGGTWPALWMLGSNFATNAWPACGEIDVMEEIGNNPNMIFATLHYPGHSGGNGVTNTTTAPNSSTQFYVYKAIWSPNSIRFYVDNVLFHTFVNSSSTPFNANFFLIMNVAMGGNFGGAINPTFTQSTMEVDYVKVYQ